MKQTKLRSVARVLLVIAAGVASMATSAHRPRPPVPYAHAAWSDWHEVLAVDEPADNAREVEGRAVVVTDATTGAVLDHRSWIEPLGGEAFRRHVMLASRPVPGHRYVVQVQRDDEWLAFERVVEGGAAVVVQPRVVTVPVEYPAPQPVRVAYAWYGAAPQPGTVLNVRLVCGGATSYTTTTWAGGDRVEVVLPAAMDASRCAVYVADPAYGYGPQPLRPYRIRMY